MLAAAAFMLFSSCEKGGSIGGSVNDCSQLDITTSQYLASEDETAVVAQLFEAAGLTGLIDSPNVTVIAPNKWSVNRYIRRHNSMTVKPADEPRYTLDSLLVSPNLAKMQMYVFEGLWGFDEIPSDGVYLTSVDGSQEIRLSLDAVTSDPTAAYDGGNVAGAGYQYTNFLMSKPKVLHVLWKRGENWELNYLDRISLGPDNEECDQAYKMYVSNVRTKNGVVHVLYVGDSAYAEQYYYHSLFFYGTRNEDK